MNWEVGKKYGDFEFVSATTTEATFKGADGKLVTYPNIFQEKSPARLQALNALNATANKAANRPHKIRENASEDTLLAELAKAKERLAALKAKRQQLTPA